MCKDVKWNNQIMSQWIIEIWDTKEKNTTV